MAPHHLRGYHAFAVRPVVNKQTVLDILLAAPSRRSHHLDLALNRVPSFRLTGVSSGTSVACFVPRADPLSGGLAV